MFLQVPVLRSRARLSHLRSPSTSTSHLWKMTAPAPVIGCSVCGMASLASSAHLKPLPSRCLCAHLGHLGANLGFKGILVRMARFGLCGDAARFRESIKLMGTLPLMFASCPVLDQIRVATLVMLEHFRCARPSQLTALYLRVSSLFFSSRVRTVALLSTSSLRPLAPLCVSLGSRVTLFIALQLSA